MTEPENAKPRVLQRLWKGWKRIARKIGDAQARGILICFYFVIFAPFALAIRWGADPLAIKGRTPRGWRPSDNEVDIPIGRATKQF